MKQSIFIDFLWCIIFNGLSIISIMVDAILMFSIYMLLNS